MRQINTFVVTRTKENLPLVIENSFKVGLRYPYPHYYIFKGDENEEEYSMLKLRPLGQRCGNVKDSRLNNVGVGIVIKMESEQMDEKLKTFLANLINFIAEDLAIDKYTILSNEISPDNFVDTFGIEAKIALAPSSFTSNPA